MEGKKLKKFTVALLTAAVITGSTIAYAADGIITSIDTDPDTQYITVSGKINSESNRERVTLRVTKAGDVPQEDTILCTYQVNTDETGEYSFGFSMPDGAEAAEYDAYVKADVTEELKQSFRYFGDISSVLSSKINGASNASQLRSFLESDNNAGMEMFGIDTEVYETLSDTGKMFVVSAVFETKRDLSGFVNGKQLRDTFNQALIIAQIRENKETINDNNIEMITVNYSKSVNGSYDSFKTMYESAKKAGSYVMTKAMSAVQTSSVKDVESFWNAYNNSVTNTVIFGTEYWTEVRDFITENRDLIGEKANISWTQYNSNVQTVCKQLVRGNYATLDTFAAAVKAAISESENPSNNNNNSIGGGGVGGGNNGIKSTSVSLPKPDNSNTGIFGSNDVSSPVTSDPYKFDDMRRTPWANDAVNYLVERKVISGYGDDTFRPENNITRAEFVTLAIKAFYGDSEMMDCDFDDVDKNAWFYPYVAAANNLGLVQGIGDNQFAPNANIVRQDMAVIIKNILDKTGCTSGAAGAEPFGDENDIRSYALDAVNTLKAEKIVNGDQNNNFNPLANTTRAEAAVIIYNVLSK